MAPKRKRAGADPTPKQTKITPIIFRSPGQTPDTLLSALGQDYQFHSMILKLHSHYFRRFLDPPDKSGERASPEFRYHYVTVVDEDDNSTWSLESVEKATPAEPAKIACLERREEKAKAFRQLLCAMYNRRYVIRSYDQLDTLTELADFFCALSVISATVVGALVMSPMLRPESSDSSGSSFSHYSMLIAECARRIRNPVLFREAFVEAVGAWEQWRRSVVNEDGSPTAMIHISVLKLAEREFTRISKLVAKCSHFLLAIMMDPKFKLAETGSRLVWDSSMQGAAFWREMRIQIEEKLEGINRRYLFESHRKICVEMKKELDHLLQNNLVLDQTRRGPGEEGYHLHIFLCANSTDEDMPWDSSEIDW